ncbi:MAG TPA: tyrosine-type recombinase/integrase, partial [Pyrinomonadaceae bacterium]|nr:tyrosine-type recombinase/integrase [Pyrinomonadaceae bacterium]
RASPDIFGRNVTPMAKSAVSLNPTRDDFEALKPLTTRHLWHIVKRKGELAGIGKLAPHDLRRTAITKAFQQNTPITAILNMSKHKSVETLMIYNKGLDNLENNAVHLINYDED